MNNFKVILAPTIEEANSYIEKNGRPEYTVEAEYGNFCVEGEKITLAHHGSRSTNPAPCNVDVEKQEGGTILVSHIDLDTIGGIMAIQGEKPEDKMFWAGAEFTDVKGPHHIHELSQEVQDKLNAFHAYSETRPRARYTEATDISEIIDEYEEKIKDVLLPERGRQQQMIRNGKEWEQDAMKKTEACLVNENDAARTFISNGVFCSASYYSPEKSAIIPATVVLNKKTDAITVAFADGGKEAGGKLSAREIVQHLWGPEAGGRDGIAGSPRGQIMTEDDLKKCTELVSREVEKTMDKTKKYVFLIEPDLDDAEDEFFEINDDKFPIIIGADNEQEAFKKAQAAMLDYIKESDLDNKDKMIQMINDKQLKYYINDLYKIGRDISVDLEYIITYTDEGCRYVDDELVENANDFMKYIAKGGYGFDGDLGDSAALFISDIVEASGGYAESVIEEADETLKYEYRAAHAKYIYKIEFVEKEENDMLNDDKIVFYVGANDKSEAIEELRDKIEEMTDSEVEGDHGDAFKVDNVFEIEYIMEDAVLHEDNPLNLYNELRGREENTKTLSEIKKEFDGIKRLYEKEIISEAEYNASGYKPLEDAISEMQEYWDFARSTYETHL